MDFFHEQDLALRSSKWLVALFLLAVACIIAGVYVIALFLFGHFASHANGQWHGWWNPRLFTWTAIGVGLVIAGGSWSKIAELSRDGGAAVATSLGGTLVSRTTDDHLERRLLNVVDEMAIASGMPVPQVYLLADESGINAFAAGTTPNNAVVAVTRGSLERLSRDELQGVIGHEFSHIFNGDMRLNLRLIGLLNGILLLALAGRVILNGSSRSRSRNSGGIALVGVGLFVLGYTGVFFGRIIKAAVSRQREFLADASSVQYTRNPDGIAGALKKIGGFDSQVSHPKAEEASHLLFAQGLTFAFEGLFATHPPLEERIARLDPAFIAVQTEGKMGGGATDELELGFASGLGGAVSPHAMESVGAPTARHSLYARRVIGQLPEAVYADLNRSETVASVLYGLLAADEKNPEARLRSVLTDGSLIERSLGHVPWMRRAGRAVRLPIDELAVPALQELSRPEVERVLADINALVKADGRISIFEFALTTVLEHAINERSPLDAQKSVDLSEIRHAVTTVLSVLAHASHADPEQTRAAFEAAATKAPLDGPWEMTAKGAISIRDLDSALERLVRVNNRFKKRFMEACLTALAADEKITINEAELFRAFGARLGVPVPPLFPGPLQNTEKAAPPTTSSVPA